jgi:hypothetical protein
MEEEAARRLITAPVRGTYDYDAEAVDLILRYSERKPWRIQRLCLEVVNRLLAERRTRVTRQDVEMGRRGAGSAGGTAATAAASSPRG